MTEKNLTPESLMFDILEPHLQELGGLLRNAAEVALTPIVALRKFATQGRGRGSVQINAEVTSFYSNIRFTLDVEVDFPKLRQTDWINEPWDGKPPSRSPHKSDHALKAGRLVVDCYRARAIVNYAAGNQPARDALVFANQLSQIGQTATLLESLAEAWLAEKARDIGVELLENLEGAASNSES